ncbi:ABC transporter permease [Spirosoma litoris]
MRPNANPPRWVHWLLTQLHPEETLEEVEGDLDELYAHWYQRAGRTQASLRYVLNVLSVLPPFVRRRKRKENYYQTSSSLNPTMLRNYIKIAWRNLWKHKLYGGINIFGLALGMACSLLIGLWVNDEWSYNRFLPGAENVYFVRLNSTYNGEIFTNDNTPGPLAATIQKDIPEVQYVTKFASWPNQLVKVGEKAAKEVGYYATSGFFDVFQLPALAGDPRTALANPNQIVISRKMAEAYFSASPGSYKQALGKQLQLDNTRYYTVGAVVENIPTNSTLRFDWVANFSLFEQPWMREWGNNAFRTYVRLQANTSTDKAEHTMRGLYARYTQFDIPIALALQPIADVYLYGIFQNGKAVSGRIEYVRIFSVVALFILLIACVNFMNLSTARSVLRAKEIGVRKVVGALRRSLLGQFLSESLLTSLLAVVLALGIVWLFLPIFNSIFDKQITLTFTDPLLWLSLLALVLVTGVIAGSYPAFYLSSLVPIRMLKGASSAVQQRFGSGSVLFRQGLVVFQFALSIFLIVAMLSVSKQLNYVRTKSLGIDRENVVAIPLEGELLFNRKEAFRQALSRSPLVASVAATNELPVNILSTSSTVNWPGRAPNFHPEISGNYVGPDFLKTMNIRLLTGREFGTNGSADSSSYIVNEAAAKLMGMKNPIGKEIEFWHGKGPIIGLISDFHIQSLHQPIAPLILAFDDKNASYFLVKLRAGQTTQALADIKRITAEFNPNYPFAYQFIDEVYGRLYQSEQQLSALINYFGILAVVISCLGLFGLATFTAEQRTKEIGVRKVLGATVASLVTLLSQDFLKLVIIAIVIASPLAWWVTNQWLQNFAYKTDISWWIFALAGLLAIGIALLTVSYQSIKAALMNPVKSLRSE